MNEKINIAEILKDCPKGMELYSLLCGECTFDSVSYGTIICKRRNGQEITFTSEGYYMTPIYDDYECLLFPSKNQRDWSKFQRPFKDGDILTTEKGSIFIYKGPMYNNKLFADFYCGYIIFDGAFVPKLFKDKHFGDISGCRFATEEEKQKLFKAIKDNGYKWNAETKTLEELIVPKFKVGDKIVKRNSISNSWIVSFVSSEYYGLTLPNGSESIGVLPVSEQDDYELLPNTNKFDITTLNPFDRVLVRHSDTDYWKPAFWGSRITNKNFPFVTSFGSTAQAIPFKGNEWLVGTTNDCDKYYKTWE